MLNNVRSVYEQLCAERRLTVMQSSMKNMLQAMLEHELKAYADAENQIIVFDYTSDGLHVMIECNFREQAGSVITHTVLPINCCEQNRREMERLIHLINYGTVQTPFEYDPRDGECRIKAAHYCGDTPLSVKQADHMIWLIIAMLHQYRDTLVPLAMGMEPDYQKTCREYNEMKLQEMTGGEENGEEEAPAEKEAEEETEEDCFEEDEDLEDCFEEDEDLEELLFEEEDEEDSAQAGGDEEASGEDAEDE